MKQYTIKDLVKKCLEQKSSKESENVKIEMWKYFKKEFDNDFESYILAISDEIFDTLYN